MDRDSKAALDLVEVLYESAVDASAWPCFLQQLASACRAIVPGLHLLGHASNEPLLVVDPDVEPRWRRAFEDYYVRHDIRRPHIQALPEGAVFRGQDVLRDAELVRSEFYNDFLRPQGFFHIAGGVFVKDECQIGVVRVLRPRGAKPFAERELRLLRLVLSHLKRAMAIRNCHASARMGEESRSAVLDSLAIGIVLLDPGGGVVWANRSANRLLQERDGLALCSAGLVASNAADTSALRRLISDAARADGVIVRGGAMTVGRGAAREPLSVLVAPLCHAGIAVPGLRASVVVFVTSPDGQVAPAVRLVQTFLGVTPAEARLAVALSRGLTVAEAARELGITESTARTHLHRLFANTRTKRQPDLVRLVLGTPAAQVILASGHDERTGAGRKARGR